MEFGAHLPLILPGDERPTARALAAYASLAERLGFTAVSANDHILFRTGWLDGPSALACAASQTERITLATSVLVPGLRHPVVAAKALGALDVLSGGRVLVGVGAGSYRPDYEACGVPFEQRWGRLDESVKVMRQLWRPEPANHPGPYYPLVNASMQPRPARGGPPIWIGSWGSEAGLRRAARLGDGWMASAYNTNPAKFRDDWATVGAYLPRYRKDTAGFGNALVTMFTFVTDRADEVDRVACDVLAPALGRQAEDLKRALLLGSAEYCAEKIRRFSEAGLQRMFIWPVAEPESQLELFAQRVIPLVV